MLTMFIVKYRHIGAAKVSVDSEHEDSASAERRALQINGKPFSPLMAWSEDSRSQPAQNTYIGGR